MKLRLREDTLHISNMREVTPGTEQHSRNLSLSHSPNGEIPTKKSDLSNDVIKDPPLRIKKFYYN